MTVNEFKVPMDDVLPIYMNRPMAYQSSGRQPFLKSRKISINKCRVMRFPQVYDCEKGKPPSQNPVVLQDSL
jgi:hypothetical protein